jgi:hypothetical protein
VFLSGEYQLINQTKISKKRETKKEYKEYTREARSEFKKKSTPEPQ